ncbi:MAG: hypothetical protein AVDCRST_MAG18-2659 [uncultured Thermomicrobiales bacterium]|uniref:Uncharacterized protein n=1 Tax=uncultured Thermomicrobiales bacterium TaxID=1645740 RepID=A0A6J4VEJ4_9BACT|nr:MAG: hypothetical protein AVDCRST_MAG18-2659 [uncultured Thermomicrobiales bacterium]
MSVHLDDPSGFSAKGRGQHLLTLGTVKSFRIVGMSPPPRNNGTRGPYISERIQEE